MEDVVAGVAHSRLSPVNIGWRIEIAREALRFFGFAQHAEMLPALGRSPECALSPLSGTDFESYLRRIGRVDDTTNPGWIADVLDALERCGLLSSFGRVNSHPWLGTSYWNVASITKGQAKGDLAFSTVFGAEVVVPSFCSVTIALSGTGKSDGAPRIASGLIADENHILTCAHVVDNMNLDQELARPRVNPPVIYGLAPSGPLHTESITSHPSADVAVVEVSERLMSLGGLVFRDPNWTDRVTLYGVPPVPLSRDADLVVQTGEVVNPDVKTIFGTDVFLYSAVARPGNSGGPIVGSDGRVLGLVTEALNVGGLPPSDDPKQPEEGSEGTALFHPAPFLGYSVRSGVFVHPVRSFRTPRSEAA